MVAGSLAFVVNEAKACHRRGLAVPACRVAGVEGAGNPVVAGFQLTGASTGYAFIAQRARISIAADSTIRDRGKTILANRRLAELATEAVRVGSADKIALVLDHAETFLNLVVTVGFSVADVGCTGQSIVAGIGGSLALAVCTNVAQGAIISVTAIVAIINRVGAGSIDADVVCAGVSVIIAEGLVFRFRLLLLLLVRVAHCAAFLTKDVVFGVTLVANQA